MKSATTRRFRELLASLPLDVQRLARKNYRLWRQNPDHPSLHCRRLKGSDNRITVRIGDHCRALGKLTGDSVVWVWIGTHAEYDRLA
jgi:hypothetical protein